MYILSSGYVPVDRGVTKYGKVVPYLTGAATTVRQRLY